MEWSFWKDPFTEDRVINIRITQRDVEATYPRNFLDKVLFDECERSDKLSDKLLALERFASILEEKDDKLFK